MTENEAKYKAAAARYYLNKANAALHELREAGFIVDVVDVSYHPHERQCGDYLRMGESTNLDVRAERVVSYTEEV